MPDACFLQSVENLQGMCDRLPGASKGLLPLPVPLPFDPVLSTLFDDFDDRDVDDRDDAELFPPRGEAGGVRRRGEGAKPVPPAVLKGQYMRQCDAASPPT